jgi:hypothetical protein
VADAVGEDGSLSDANRWLLETVMAAPVDKLDIRIPKGTMFSKELDRELRHSDGAFIRCTKHYARVEDLRHFGRSSILYSGQRWNGNYKLEIVGTGMMTLPEIASEISNVFDVDPRSAEIMRVDLAVDVQGYPVDWFRRCARVSHKRYSSEYTRFVSEHAQVETLYFGKRPNIFRVYDKTEEQGVDYRRLIRKARAGEPIPTFQARYGHPENEILTRVERQYGGGRVPKQIATLEKLQENALCFNPFESLQFLPGSICEESVNQLNGDAFIKGHGFLRLVERHGYTEARRLLDQKTCRNTTRLLAAIGNCMSPDSTCAPPDLHGLFREAIGKQLATPMRCL